jgi:hypothetical protein
MFNLKELKKVEVKENYRVDISKRFASLIDLVAEVEISSV